MPADAMVWADDVHAGSVPMELERMLQRCADADVWVVKYAAPHELTYEMLQREQPLYTRFRAFRQRRVGLQHPAQRLLRRNTFCPLAAIARLAQCAHC